MFYQDDDDMLCCDVSLFFDSPGCGCGGCGSSTTFSQCQGGNMAPLNTGGACIIPPDALQTATSSADTPPPCGGNGEALPSTLYDVTLVSYNDDNYNGFFTQLDASQCFPRTTNGVVAQAEIVMTENP